MVLIVLRYVSEHCSSRWEGFNRWYSTGSGWVPRTKRVAPELIWISSFSPSSAKRNKQDKTSVVPRQHFITESDDILQVNNCDGRFNTGSLPLTRQRIKISFGRHDIKEPQHGFSRATR